MSRRRVVLQRVLPALVSAAILTLLFQQLDVGEAWDRAQDADLSIWLPFLLLYGLGCVLFDGLALEAAVPADHRPSLWQAARLRAATYPLAILHYAFGSLGLIALLRRRLGLAVMPATGVVGLLAAADLGILLVGAAGSAAFLATRPPPIDRLVLVSFVGVMILAFLLVRRGGVGPLRRVTDLDVFRSLREISWPRLFALAAARVGFLGLFLVLGGITLAAFGIRVPVGDLIVNLAATALVAALPIALSGLGTSQATMVVLFAPWAGPEELLAASLTLSAGIVVTRVAVGLCFAGEYMRAAYADVREQEEAADAAAEGAG